MDESQKNGRQLKTVYFISLIYFQDDRMTPCFLRNIGPPMFP